jgi:malonate transporter and related proteins
MLDVFLSLVPVFSLILLGAVLRRFKVLSLDGWSALERLTYFVLFPPLMFMSIVEGSFAGEEALKLAGVLGLTVLVVAGLMMLARPLLAKTGGQFSSVFLAGIRWNAYIALGVIAGLFGDQGRALAAVGFAVMVPINNVTSVIVMNRYAGAEPASVLRILRSVAIDPVIISTVLAVVLVGFGVTAPKPIGDTLNLLGNATVSLGLICVGAALDFVSLRGSVRAMTTGTLLRLAVMPAATVGFCMLMGLRGMGFEVAMICVAAPVATSTYVLTRQSGGDSGLMANLITLTTLLSLVTIPLTVWLAQQVQ